MVAALTPDARRIVRHTPGPWYVMGRYVAVRGDVQARAVAAWAPPASRDGGPGSVAWAVDGPASLEALSNARLIAAAPALLDALHQVALLAVWGDDTLTLAQVATLRASIAAIAREAIEAADAQLPPGSQSC